MLDLILTHARLPQGPLSIGIADGRIAALGHNLGPAREVRDLGGRAVLPGLVDAHIHLDKAGLLCRCGQVGSLQEAVAAVSALKGDFTVADVHARGAKVIEAAICQGTMHMRSHVEVDPRAGLRSLQAVLALRAEYAFALDLQVCAFAQEGLTNDPGTGALLEQALELGADLLGGCPYTDSVPLAQIDILFDMAARHDVDLDFHLDFDLDPEGSHIRAICDRTIRQGWQGRVNLGHVTKLAAMDDNALAAHANLLARADVAVTALPATDLYLNGMDQGHRAPRGVAPLHLLEDVTVAVATNNVMNPFTPYGDCSLLRMANLYANVMHLGAGDFPICLQMITDGPARILRLADYGLSVGDHAHLIVLDAATPEDALATIATPLMGFKGGRQSFDRTAARLLRP
ncbi:amidohydrolase family protein [Paracoccus nototheniae]|uniref:Amidohydrolase family protein n=1 Tax=Paracoccus nototheniae TaxID=2489002 RepID=A0ABW4DZ83_9RHOB|nr:amidohydrolase family protein [Paracoccus nototheniae]